MPDTQEIVKGKYKVTQRLRDRLGGIGTISMGGDNISILLCGYFENPDDPEGENGWPDAAVDSCNEALDAIHGHYVEAIETRIARVEALEKALREIVGYSDHNGMTRVRMRQIARTALEQLGRP